MPVQRRTNALEQRVHLPIDSFRCPENEHVVIHIDWDPIQRYSQRHCYHRGVTVPLGIDEIYGCEVEAQTGIGHLVNDASLMLPHRRLEAVKKQVHCIRSASTQGLRRLNLHR